MKETKSAISELLEELERRQEHIKKLQMDIGRWKRLAQEKPYQPEFIREQHDERGRHIIEFFLKEIPGDLDYRDVLDYLKYELLPHHYPYYYHSCYQSKKYKGWIVKIAKDDNVDMSYLPENIGNSYKEVLNQLQWDIMMQLHRFEKYVMAVSIDAPDNEIIKANELVKALQQSFNAVQQIKIK